MLAAQRFQIIFIQRLHANGNTVHPRRAIAPEIFGLDTCWIGLKGNFNRICNGPKLRDLVNDFRNSGRRHERRRAAAKENAAHLAARRDVGKPFQFRGKRLCK